MKKDKINPQQASDKSGGTGLLPLPHQLQPTQLSQVTQSAVDDLLREGESQNTLVSYRSALRYWAAWFQMRYGVPIQLPVPVPVILQFIVDHALRSTPQGLVSELPAELDQALVAAGYKGKLGALAHNTLVHRIAVLSKAHQLRQLPNPCQDAEVRELLSRTRKAYAKRGPLQRKKAAMTKDPLQAVLATCDDSLRGLRDRALLLFAWASGGRRRSEVAGADMQFLRRVGPSEFVYTLYHSKTNQSGSDRPDNTKPVLGAAGAALEAWLQASAISSGPIFRRIRKGGHLGEGLSPAAVRAIVQERCLLAGVEGDFSAHSLRSGFVTEAGRQNVPLADTMALTGHQSVPTVLGYFRAESALDNSAGRLLDE
jgi:integrase